MGKMYKGIALTSFTIGTKKPQKYNRGDEVKTTKKDRFEYLINTKRIK